ncbi:MAG: polynucleotide adenylyltransferase PcnB [Rubrivivax sp.]
MIKKFIKRLLGQSAGPAGPAASAASASAPPPVITLGQRIELAPEQHGIDPSLLDANAVRVVRTLKEAGYEAYIVGGAVRDLIVGQRPKDFDVATDATPEQVKGLFRRAFIIGRRFRIVHVVFGRGREHETIEVSTFRAYLDNAAAEPVAGNEKTSKAELADKQHAVDASGRVLRDNVWGPQIEDAARRDFTINAMYYDPLTQTVVDYHGGLADARARVIRMIGDAPTRYREDPVRIVRVVRFAAKLGFTIDAATERPIRGAKALLANVPASRLFDETVKLLQTGHAVASVEQIRRFGLERGVFPVLEPVLAPAQPHAARDTFVRLALEDTDRRVAEGRTVVPSFMLACLLWHEVLERWSAQREAGLAPFPALQQAVDAVFDARIGDISGRGKLAADMREIWLMQPRFERRTPGAAAALLNQPRFRAGYDFLRLRADAGEVAGELADWWEDFHLGSDEEREAMLAERRAASATRVRKGGERSAAGARAASATAAVDLLLPDAAAAHDADQVPAAQAASADAAAEGAATRRRRRRRRRPAAAPADGAEGADAPSSQA